MPQPTKSMDKCRFETCPKDRKFLGFCSGHYGQSRKGKTLTHIPRSASERFWSKVNKNGGKSQYLPAGGECWVWEGALPAGRYGHLTRDKKHHYAHIVSYEETHGKLPEGLEVDHRCFNPRCVNPDHLEAVTHQENQRRLIEHKLHRDKSGKFTRREG